ncbi:MAG TPA: sterol desaturase family protein [Solirubrobacterales bacterium]|nr:sterol desaturase family protein [Solirubrobacterales bacterium]
MAARAEYGPDVKTLGEAARQFGRRHSPWMILGSVAVLVTIRFAIADPLTWRDAVAAAAMAAVYPFGEWAIHVYLLHAPPLRIGGREFELLTTREHGSHHRHPNNLMTLLLGPKELVGLFLLAVPLVVGVGGLLVGSVAGPVPIGALLSAAIAGYVLVGVYEWTHYLIHTAYRPRTRAYRAVWRNHRLHHFKNEHYWHGITNTVADRVLGTMPDHREVERSRTARTLRE